MNPSRIVTACVTLAGLLWLVAVAAFAAEQSIDLPVGHLDGAFQTASALRRLSGGEWPGRDFLPYLGLGPVWSLLPLYRLAGSDLSAAVTAAFAVTVLAGWLMTMSVVYFAWPTSRARDAALVATLVVAVVVAAFPMLPRLLLETFSPGQSLRPVRAALVPAAALLTHLVVTHRGSVAARAIGVGVIAGVSFLWSNDFGIPTAGAVLAAGWLWAHAAGATRRYLALAPLAAGGSVLAVGLAATAGGLASLLAFNFRDIRTDQWWYFGPWWDPAYRVFGLADLPRMLLSPLSGLGWNERINFTLITGLVAVAVAVVRAIRHPDPRSVGLAGTGLALLGACLIVCIGGSVLKSYALALSYWSVLVLALLGSRLAWRGVRRVLPFPVASVARGVAGLAIATVLVTAASAASRVEALVRHRDAARADPARFRVPELGGYLAREWQPYLAGIRAAPGRESVYEEYGGLWYELLRPRHPWPVDSAIHALGATRTRVVREIDAHPPRWVVTSTPQLAGEWWSWNVGANWWLYRRLLSHYAPHHESATTVVWERSTPRAWTPVACELDPAGATFRLPGGPGLYEVTLDYRYRAPPLHRSLLLVRNQFNRPGGGYLSIDPAARRAQLPVIVRDPGGESFAVLSAETLHEPPPDALQLQGCSAARIPLPAQFPLQAYPREGELLPDGDGPPPPRNVVQVAYSPDAVRRFVPGVEVCLPDGRAGTIGRVDLVRNDFRRLRIALQGLRVDAATGASKVDGSAGGGRLTTCGP